MPRYAKRRRARPTLPTRRNIAARVGKVLAGYGGGSTKLTGQRFFTTGGVRRSSASGQLQHKHVINVLQSQTAPLAIGTDPAGISLWVFAPNISSTNIAFMFSLSSVRIFSAGVLQMTCPVPGTATLQAMYDSWRLDQVDIEMYTGTAMSQDAAGNGSFSLFAPTIAFAPDSEDISNTTIDELLQYSTAQFTQPQAGIPLKCSLKPAAALGVGAGPAGAVAGYGRKYSPVLSIATPDVGHFGLKMVTDQAKQVSNPATTRLTSAVSFRFRYHLTMIGTR